MDRYAVIGNPIGHSKSPQIHIAFARQTGQPIEYTRLLAEIDAFEARVREFFSAGGRGLNVTVPFKEAAWRLADQHTRRAKIAGAVNTLMVLQDSSLRGDNTDGAGLVRDLRDNHGVRLQGTRILLLGAGGAARGIIQPLLEAGTQSIIIANRTASKAELLARRMARLGAVQGCGLEQLVGQRFEIIVNATAAGLKGEVPAIPNGIVTARGCCYDMMYGDQPTAFVRWGWAQGAANSLDGLGMLVEQAAEAFFVWRGVRPETRPVIEDLRRSG